MNLYGRRIVSTEAYYKKDQVWIMEFREVGAIKLKAISHPLPTLYMCFTMPDSSKAHKYNM